MVRRRRPLVALVIALAAFATTSTPARADPATVARAQALFDEALALMKAGKYAEACPKLEESDQLDPGMGTEYRLAECYESDGKNDLTDLPGKPDAGLPCDVDVQCDDKNPCTADTCTEGGCEHAAQPDGPAPSSFQVAFDCNVEVCVDGMSMRSPDDSDLPKTASECDEELCSSGLPSNPPLPDTVTCGPQKDRKCDGSGNCKKVNGQTCAATSECVNGTCVDSVCCGVASCPVCYSCAQGGVCGPIASGMPDIAAPNTCMGTSLCDGMGNCKKVNGQTCATTLECVTGTCVDGVCCGVTECPACQSCTLGVMPGTCGNIANGQPDNTAPNTCPGNTTCDGAGNCVKAANGQPCMAAQANKCQSGICADGVCCDVTCDNAVTCKSCSLPTKEGTCSPVISADDIDSCPPATTTCSATSMCLTKIGSPCSANGECASGNCSSGMMKVCQ